MVFFRLLLVLFVYSFLTSCEITEMFSDQGSDDFLNEQLGDGETGEGIITFYTTNGQTGYITLYINGSNAGYLTNYWVNGTPSCGSSDKGTVSVSLPAGTHQLYATSSKGATWDFTFTVKAYKCLKIAL